MGSLAQNLYDDFISKNRYRYLLDGLGNTLVITIFALIIGVVLGVLVALTRVTYQQAEHRSVLLRILNFIGGLYLTVIRGTPMVVQLLIIHFVLFPAMRIQFKNLIITQNFSLQGVVIEAIIAFALNSGAYMSEIMRGGISSIDKGQLEAGRALGLSYPKTMVSVVLPQAFKNVLPTLGNEFIALIKETSVVSFIAVTDLTKAFQNIANSTYEFIVPYLVLALCYLILVILISLLVKFLEKKLKKA